MMRQTVRRFQAPRLRPATVLPASADEGELHAHVGLEVLVGVGFSGFEHQCFPEILWEGPQKALFQLHVARRRASG